MGRVAKYKKIKACDPYSKKNRGNLDLANVGVWGLGDNGRKAKKRSRKAELMRKKKKRRTSDDDDDDGFDLPPTNKDEFDLADLVGSVKKEKQKNLMADASEESAYKIALKGNVVATLPKTDADEKKVARMLNLESQLKEKVNKKVAESHARMEGESKRAYARRTKVETRQIIQKSAVINPEKRLKKNEFLKQKKNKKKGSHDITTSVDNGSDGGSFITGERAVAEVRFGEQAERPPTFKAFPRGAKAKDQKSKSASKSKGMTNAQVAAENNAMELMRRKVQAQYASIKAKRKRAGDFHL